MSMNALFKVMSEFTNLLNDVNNSGRELTQQQIQKVQDLTNDEVWWTYAQAVITGSAGALGGASGIAGAAINSPIRGMSADNIKAIAKAFATGIEMIGNVGNTVAKGKTISDQSERSLADRCGIAGLQQADGNRNSAYSQLVQAINGIQSAKARLTAG